MRTFAIAALAGTLLVAASAESLAQSGRRGREPNRAEAAEATRLRGRPMYDQQGDGTIRWNTPNASGNFGTPSGPGGGGGP